mmetsp:Transcript_12403/g.39553  ORF Transcript_12403/g.39553 Transcript_12403/m.39553 type:complete len:132 (-) Transcript_12403:16-411(-)
MAPRASRLSASSRASCHWPKVCEPPLPPASASAALSPSSTSMSSVVGGAGGGEGGEGGEGGTEGGEGGEGAGEGGEGGEGELGSFVHGPNGAPRGRIVRDAPGSRAAQPVRLGLEEVVHGPLQNSPLAGAA